MDEKILLKPQELIELLNDKNKKEVKEIMGHNLYHSDFDVWLYRLSGNWFFRREMTLFFEKEEVIEIVIIDYWLAKQKRVYILD